MEPYHLPELFPRNSSNFVTLDYERADAHNKKLKFILDADPQKNQDVESATISNPGPSSQQANTAEASVCDISQDPVSFESITTLDLCALVKNFTSSVSSEDLCENLLKLAYFYKSGDRVKAQHNYGVLTSNILNSLNFEEKSCDVMFCQLLFVCILTRIALTEEQKETVKSFLLLYFKSKKDCSFYSANYNEISLCTLPEKFCILAEEVIKGSINPSIFSISKATGAFQLCCVATCNMLMNFDDNKRRTEMLSKGENSFQCAISDFLLKRVESLVGSIQILSYKSKDNCEGNEKAYEFWMKDIGDCFSVLLGTCLKEARHFLLDFNDMQFLRNINWIFGFCLKKIFSKPNMQFSLEIDTPLLVTEDIYKACTLAILKILTHMCYIPSHDKNEIGIAIIEKCLLCFLKTTYSNLREKFNLQILSLELILLLFKSEWVLKKSFYQVLLMKLKIEGPPLSAVDLLLKVLSVHLIKIRKLEKMKNPAAPNSDTGMSILQQRCSYDEVQQFGEDHLDYNFIASYVLILLSIFCDGKESFNDYVFNKISKFERKACVNILVKFKEFLIILGHPVVADLTFLNRATEVFRNFG